MNEGGGGGRQRVISCLIHERFEYFYRDREISVWQRASCGFSGLDFSAFDFFPTR